MSHTTTHLVPPSVVRSTIAHAVLGSRADSTRDRASATALGAITLLPHQHDAVVRLRDILRNLHIALLADDVGLGKTYTALAIAREYANVRVIAPAALLPMWRNAIARTTCHHVRVESIQRYSRMSDCPPFAPNTLVIIDEAHHLRTPTTKRYTALSQRVAGCDVLLLSATPIHNAPRDLRALLALGLGGSAARLSQSLLASVIVRRTDGAERPRVASQPPIVLPQQPDLLNAILALPAPLPARDGAVAGALVRLGLLRAWCSSDAALRQALRRRLMRGEALRHALAAGRHPTTAELRAWLVGEHEVQLAFPELLAQHSAEPGPLLEILDAHLDAVSRLERQLRTALSADAARAGALREILARHPGQPVVAFTQFAETVRAVSRALADIAGVGALTGSRAWIASGPVTRADALAQFAPTAQGKPPPPAHQRIRLLLATDLLAEGVNLQDAAVVVHLDLPWTDALRQQRVGRCVRVGSPHAEVAVYQLEPHTGAARILQLEQRLHRKARITARLIGVQRPRHADGAQPGTASAADVASHQRALLVTWANQSDRAATASRTPGVVLSWVPADQPGFIALCRAVHAPDETPRPVGWALSDQCGDAMLLAGPLDQRTNGRPRALITNSPARVYAALQQLHRAADARGGESACSPGPVHECTRRAQALLPIVRRAVRRWCARRAFADDMRGPVVGASAVHRRARAMLEQTLARLTTSQRIASRIRVQAAYRMIESARGAGAERALVLWMATRPQLGTLEWLDAWRHSGPLCVAPAELTELARAIIAPDQWRVDAVVVFQPLA